MREQEAPFTLKCELTRGCNLRCEFCAIQSIRGPLGEDDRYEYMTVQTATAIARDVKDAGWNCRWEFTLSGEPSLNPQRNEIITAIRKTLPKAHLMMTSNGGGFVKKPGAVANVIDIFDAGLNVLALDDYKDVNIVPKIRDVVYKDKSHRETQEWVKDAGIDVYEYPDQSEGSPYHRHNGKRVITFLRDLRDTTADGEGVRTNISNQGGDAYPKNDRMAGKRCARPFRELAIRFDGKMMLCCNDWRGKFKIGDIKEDTLDYLWQSPEMNAVRQKLYYGERDFGPCDGCDSKSFRTGLLPDPSGKAELPKPTAETATIIRKALAGPTMSEPVLRPWEK